MKVRSPTIIQYIISAINISRPEDFLQKDVQKPFTHMRANDHQAMPQHKRHPASKERQNDDQLNFDYCEDNY